MDVILGLLPLVLGIQLLIWIVYFPTALRGFADFRTFYSTGVLVRTYQGDHIFDYETQRNVQDALISPSATELPYIHPAYQALIFAPLSLFRYRYAFLVWLGISLTLLLMSFWTLKRHLGGFHDSWRWLPILYFVGFAPVSGALLQGQDSIVTLFLFSLSLIALSLGKEEFAGLLVGVAFYKFTLVLPIVFLLLLWRRWRFVGGACLSIAIAIALSALITGSHILLSYPRYLLHASIALAPVMPAERMPNLRGLVSLLHLAPVAADGLLITLSVALIVIVTWYGRSGTATWQFSLAISAATLVGYHVMMHDLSVMLIPMAVFSGRVGSRGLWSNVLLWLSSVVCFFGLGPVVAAPLLAFVVLHAIDPHSLRPSWTQNALIGNNDGIPA